MALDDTQARLACLWGAAASALPQEIAAVVCSERERSKASAVAALAGSLHGRVVSEIPAFAMQVASYCPELEYPGDLIYAALLQLEQNQPGTIAELCASAEPGWVFGGGDDKTWTRVVGKLARDGDLSAARFLSDVAIGELPCRRMQYDEALLHYSLLGRPAAELLSTLAAALESRTLAAHPEASGMVVMVLLEPKSWPGGDSAAALAQVARCLQDPRFALSSAVQVLSHTRSGPHGVDPMIWPVVWAQATDVAVANGIQGAGQRD